MRAAASFLFLAGLCAVLFWAVRTAHGDEIREIDPEVRIAAKHEAATEDLARALDAAIANARQAEASAMELEEAIAQSRATSRELASLGYTNEAVPTSLEAVAVTARKGDRAVSVMRRYAATLNAGVADVETLSDQAVKMASAIEKVEQSKAEAERAVAEAAAVKSEVETATENSSGS